MKIRSRSREQHDTAALVRTVREHAIPALLVLPSLPASYALAEALVDAGPVRIVGNPAWLRERAPALAAHASSPLCLWRDAKAAAEPCAALPWTVVSFPDQLVGNDASYTRVDIAGERYLFSLVEMMLLMRFRMPCLVGRAAAARASLPTRLSLEPVPVDLPDRPSRDRFDATLGSLMRGVVECRAAGFPDWHARDLFALKAGDNYERMLSLRLLEIEGLLRLMERPDDAVPASRALLEAIGTARRKLPRSPATRAGPQPAPARSCAVPTAGLPGYAYLPRWLNAADRLRPALGFRWPEMRGGLPPAELLAHGDHYEAVAWGHRLRTRCLQADAFAVQGDGLDRYVANHVNADVDALRGWMNAGQGAIFACPHYGPFLSGALLFASLGTEASPSHVFYDPAGAVPENQRFDELFRRFGGRLNVLHNEPRDLVRAARALRDKQCISIMFDVVQRPTDSMFIPFCGRLYPAMGGAAYLSLQSGAPLIPAYVVPDEGRKARVVFGQPILPGEHAGADREQNVYDMTRRLFQDFERQLRAAPWHWIYWDAVVRAPALAPDATTDPASQRQELRRRVQATPALLDLVPDLRVFTAEPGTVREAGSVAEVEGERLARV